MIVTLKVKKEFDVKTVLVSAKVRYWEDGSVNGEEDTNGDLIPCRNGNNWEPEIDIETGQILKWKQGTTAYVHYKVCDAGVYKIKDANGDIVLEKHDYVPSTLCPEENGYGDYIIMNIDENGFVKNWKFNIKDFK